MRNLTVSLGVDPYTQKIEEMGYCATLSTGIHPGMVHYVVYKNGNVVHKQLFSSDSDVGYQALLGLMAQLECTNKIQKEVKVVIGPQTYIFTEMEG